MEPTLLLSRTVSPTRRLYDHNGKALCKKSAQSFQVAQTPDKTNNHVQVLDALRQFKHALRIIPIGPYFPSFMNSFLDMAPL